LKYADQPASRRFSLSRTLGHEPFSPGFRRSPILSLMRCTLFREGLAPRYFCFTTKDTKGHEARACRTEKGSPLRKILDPELARRPLAVFRERALAAAQLDPADLARRGLGQLGELDAAHALVGREPPAHVIEDRGRRRRIRLEAGRANDIGLRNRVAHRIGDRHD